MVRQKKKKLLSLPQSVFTLENILSEGLQRPDLPSLHPPLCRAPLTHKQGFDIPKQFTLDLQKGLPIEPAA